MNYETTTYIYGPSKLALKYPKEELNDLIEKFITDNKNFSFSQLCNYILSEADQHDMLEKKNNTSYSQILLTYADTITISKLLWDRIWNKELIQLFNNPHDIYHNNDAYFVKI